MSKNYQAFKTHMQKCADVNAAQAALMWDQEVYMPAKGASGRAQQLSTLAGMAHELSVDKAFGDLLQTLNQDDSLSKKEAKNVALAKEEYDRHLKYTAEFVSKQSRTVSEAFQAWNQARKEEDFQVFAPKLKELIALKKEESELLGYEAHPYDAHLNLYEPGATVAELDVLFNDVRAQLVDFVAEIAKLPQPNEAFLTQHYPKDQQWDFGMELLTQMGFDFESGRQDISAHPFTMSLNPNDVRLTTRIDENDISEMIWSCIHEGGHGLYEQGFLPEDAGLPSAMATSLAIHESQSRLWENNVCRSLPYWEGNFERVLGYFPEQFKGVSVAQFYHAMNAVKPSLVRTNADELTYHFHVLIRYEIEKALFENTLEVEDLEAVWNAKYKEYLQVDVPKASLGILQDIHWCHGSFGYFPTYSLGSFYAAQFFECATQQVPGLEADIRKGNFEPLLNWLRENIHQHGKLYSAKELCERITGEGLNFSYFMKYAKKKYGNIYNFASFPTV